MKIALSEHFNYRKLFRFVLPSIVMMVITSIYSVVDGLFVSNFVGKTPFAAINLIMPIIMILGAIGFMMGTGGSALVSKTLGEGNKKKANNIFSLLIYTTIVIGIVLALLGAIFMRPIALLLGATPDMIDDCVIYGRIIMICLTFFMLQNIFQSFLVVAEKPKIGLAVTICAGLTNVFLDALFILVFKWGLVGAAIATALSQTVGGVIPLIYFIVNKRNVIHIGKTKFDGRALLKTCTNGSSELMTNVSASVVNMLFNFQLIHFAGENGVAAYGVIMYVSFIFSAIFFGYSIGTAPIIGYHYGSGNTRELKNLFKKSLILISISGVAMTGLALALSTPLSMLFAHYDAELFSMTKHAFLIYSFVFLIIGFNIFSSSFFTSLNNGLISALISFLRTLVFQILCVMVLPIFFQIDGVWFSVIAAELLSLIPSVIFLVVYRKKYQYI